MKGFNIVFYIFIIFMSLNFLLLSCNKSLEEVEGGYTQDILSLTDEEKQIENELSSNLMKGLIVVPCVEDKSMALMPKELSQSEQEEKKQAYADLIKIIVDYKSELIDGLQRFEAENVRINKEIETAELEDITLKDDYEEEQLSFNDQDSIKKPLLSKSHLHKVSQEFKDQSLVNSVYASLGYDIRVINKLERMIYSLDLDVDVKVDSEADKQLHDELLSLSYSMLFCLSHITNSAMRITNEYFNELTLFSLEKVNFTQKFVDLHEHISEFIQSRAQFIENIKNLILDIKIDNKKRMLIVLRNLMQDKGEIISASNFTQRKASIIKCEIDNLLRT